MQSLNHRSVLPNGVRQSHNLRACLRSWFLCFSVSIFGVSPPLDPFSECKFSLTFFECRESVWGQFSSCFFAGDFHHSFHGKWEALWLEAGSSLWHQCVIQTRKVSPKASPKNSPESDNELDRSQSMKSIWLPMDPKKVVGPGMVILEDLLPVFVPHFLTVDFFGKVWVTGDQCRNCQEAAGGSLDHATVKSLGCTSCNFINDPSFIFTCFVCPRPFRKFFRNAYGVMFYVYNTYIYIHMYVYIPTFIGYIIFIGRPHIMSPLD